MNDGTWAMYTIGVVALFVAAVFTLTLFQMRRTIVDVAAQRLGHVAGGMAGIGISLIALRALADRLDEAALWVSVVAFGSAFVLALVLGYFGAQQALALAQRSNTGEAKVAPTMKLEPGQRAVWSSTLSSKWLLIPAIGVLLLGPLFMFAPDAPAWLLGVVVLAGVACLSLSSIRVTADASGLSVSYGVLPWPKTNIAVDRIESASVIDVRPMEWGGWGYRGTLTLMRQAAVVLRAGPGIRVDLSDGRVFVVTVDNPETPVALLNAEVQRTAASV